MDISIGQSVALTGNATESDVASGKTFYNTDAKTKLTGTHVPTFTDKKHDVYINTTTYTLSKANTYLLTSDYSESNARSTKIYKWVNSTLTLVSSYSMNTSVSCGSVTASISGSNVVFTFSATGNWNFVEIVQVD